MSACCSPLLVSCGGDAQRRRCLDLSESSDNTARAMSHLPLLLLCLLSFFFPLTSAEDSFPPGFWDPVVQSLDGSDWVLENANRSIRLTNATVPGSVWTSLLADPLYGYLERDEQWINDEAWWHLSKVFEVNQSLWYDFVSFYYEVVLEGVDCLSRVLINGVDVGRPDGYTTSNAFRRYTYPAPLLDNSQFNRIDVYLYPVRPYIDAAAAAYPYPIPAIDPDSIESNRSFIRKATSDFGWDFAPHFIGVGIHKSVYLRAFNQAFIQDVTIRQTRGSDMQQTERDQWGMATTDVLLNVTAFLRTPPHPSSGQLSVHIAGLSAALPIAFPAPPTTDGDFLYSASLLLPVPSPTLWWPHTHGTPFLYDLTLTFNGSSTGNEGLHTVTRRVGFRSIRVVRDPTGDSPGLSFQFVVNDVPVFVKGANLTPLDPFYARVTEANVSNILQSAVDANMNMLRVWGGGPYQSDLVYDWADAHGLLIWQEVAFACQMVPVRSSYLDSIREEVTQQVRRLGSHASLAIIGGNNENEEALDWWPVTQLNRDQYLVDYAQLYISTVRDAVVREIGLDVEYVTSSPSNGPLSMDPYVQRWGSPGDYTYGDTHFYPDPAQSDFAEPSTWPRARFVSEFGFPSFASRLTMETSAPSPSDVAINSTYLNWRQRYGLVQADGSTWVTEVNLLEVSKHFRLPSTSNASAYYDDFTYLSQANQALAYSTALQAFRRQMSEPPSFTSGCLFWQLNDIMQAPSYAAIEYGGRWKMVMYAAKGDYADKIVSGYVWPLLNGTRAQFGVYIVNDGQLPISGLLTADVRRWSDSARVVRHNLTYKAQALGATRLWVTTVEALLNGTCQPRECYVTLTATWDDGGKQGVMHNVVYLTHLPQVELARPTFVVSLVSAGPLSIHSSRATHHQRHPIAADGSNGLAHDARLEVQVGCDEPYPLAPLAAQVMGNQPVRELVLQLRASQTSPFTWVETAMPGRWSDNGLLIVGGTAVNLTFTADEPVDQAALLMTTTLRAVYCTYNRQ